MPEPWLFLLYALATARLTLLISNDNLLDEPRAWVLDKLTPEDGDGEPLPVAWWRRKLAYLIVCIWCLPMWIAGVIAYPLWRWHPDHPVVQAGVTILALAMTASLLAKVGRDD